MKRNVIVGIVLLVALLSSPLFGGGSAEGGADAKKLSNRYKFRLQRLVQGVHITQ